MSGFLFCRFSLLFRFCFVASLAIRTSREHIWPGHSAQQCVCVAPPSLFIVHRLVWICWENRLGFCKTNRLNRKLLCRDSFQHFSFIVFVDWSKRNIVLAMDCVMKSNEWMNWKRLYSFYCAATVNEIITEIDSSVVLTLTVNNFFVGGISISQMHRLKIGTRALTL